MAEPTVEIIGADLFADMMKERMKTFRSDVINIVQSAGVRTQLYAKVLAPVDTGNLKRRIEYYFENGGYQSRVASNAYYAIYQEVGTRKQSGTPHIRPAFLREKDIFLSELRGLFKE